MRDVAGNAYTYKGSVTTLKVCAVELHDGFDDNSSVSQRGGTKAFAEVHSRHTRPVGLHLKTVAENATAVARADRSDRALREKSRLWCANDGGDRDCPIRSSGQQYGPGADLRLGHPQHKKEGASLPLSARLQYSEQYSRARPPSHQTSGQATNQGFMDLVRIHGLVHAWASPVQKDAPAALD